MISGSGVNGPLCIAKCGNYRRYKNKTDMSKVNRDLMAYGKASGAFEYAAKRYM